MQQLKDTPCKNCCFVEWDGNTQVGCHAGALDKFRNYGIEVIQAYDSDKEFEVVKGVRCQLARSNKWCADKTLDEKIALATQQAKMLYQSFVICNHNLDDILDMVNSLANQSLPPQRIYIIRPHTCKVEAIEIIRELLSLKIEWKLVDVKDLDLTLWDQIDIRLNQKKLPYYSVHNTGAGKPDEEYFSELSDRINFAKFRFAAIGSDDGYIIPFAIHFNLGGHAKEHILTKIRRKEQEDARWKVHPWYW